jgi:hypothetical protein
MVMSEKHLALAAEEGGDVQVLTFFHGGFGTLKPAACTGRLEALIEGLLLGRHGLAGGWLGDGKGADHWWCVSAGGDWTDRADVVKVRSAAAGGRPDDQGTGWGLFFRGAVFDIRFGRLWPFRFTLDDITEDKPPRRRGRFVKCWRLWFRRGGGARFVRGRWNFTEADDGLRLDGSHRLRGCLVNVFFLINIFLLFLLDWGNHGSGRNVGF